MGSFKTLDSIAAKGKRVVVRQDLNVPAKDGVVTDATRIQRAAQTIRELSDKGAKVIIVSHFGRPKGREEKYSQKFLLGSIADAIGRPVKFVDDVIGPKVEKAIADLADGDVLLTENVRFYPEEEKNVQSFAKSLAALGDIYVNDAFSTAHRAHASTEGIAHILPSYAGRLMQQELDALGKALEHPEKPVAALVGGAKVSTKLELLGNMVSKVNCLVIGGGMANTFLFAQGHAVGKSLCEKEMAGTAREILEKAKKAGCQIVLPTDVVIAGEFAAGAANKVVPADKVPDDQMILDAGPATVEMIKSLISNWKTLVWNGPLGAFEINPFDAATNAVAQAAAEATVAGKLLTVAGGGDTVSALAHAGVEEKFSYISSAGGAFLEWLEGKDLPGVAALKK